MTTRELLRAVAFDMEGQTRLSKAAALRALAARLDDEEARARAIASAGESAFDEATAKDRIELIIRLDADLG